MTRQAAADGLYHPGADAYREALEAARHRH